MASFKEHCAFGFWKGKLLASLDRSKSPDAAGQYGRLTSLADLPPDKTVVRQVQEAARLNDEGMKTPPQRKAEKKAPLQIPTYFKAALKENAAAQATFDNFSYSHKKEYIQWITEAKTDATREKRISQALDWLAEGKSRHWKYQSC